MKNFRYSLSLLFLCLLASGCKKDGTGLNDLDNVNRGPDNSAIPYAFIDTKGAAIIDEPKIKANFYLFENQQPIFTSRIGIEYRGSTSQRLFPKKSYGLELWDKNGLDYSADIFGMGAEEDWILYGPYSDKTLLRNLLIYDLSNEIGQYAPETQLVELNVNNIYEGVYVFMEKIKQDTDRLPIEKLDETMTASSVISGGYILKIDKTTGDTSDPDWSGDYDYTEPLGFRSDYDTHGNLLTYGAYGPKQSQETYFLYEEPAPEEINQNQKNYINNYVRSFEQALANEDFSSMPRAYEQFIDVDSFVDFFLLNEISANPDAYRLSTFLHKDRGGKLKMGPIWDFNIAFGNDGRSATDTWIYQYNQRVPNDLWLVHFWWTKLLDDPYFRSLVKSRWTELRNGSFQLSAIHAKIDEWAAYLDQNQGLNRNFERWPVIGEALPFNSFVGATYQEEVDYVKGWIGDRLNWMDSQISAW